MIYLFIYYIFIVGFLSIEVQNLQEQHSGQGDSKVKENYAK